MCIFEFTALADGRSLAREALADLAELIITGGACPTCLALGSHDRVDQGFRCRECAGTFGFEPVRGNHAVAACRK